MIRGQRHTIRFRLEPPAVMGDNLRNAINVAASTTSSPSPWNVHPQYMSQHNQRDGFRRYLEGLLLPIERNKTLTALANTEPVVGAQHPRAQGLQWFLSESTWDPARVNARRIALLGTDPLTAPTAQGVLVIDEHGDRKWGHKTAHVGTQYLNASRKVTQHIRVPVAV